MSNPESMGYGLEPSVESGFLDVVRDSKHFANDAMGPPLVFVPSKKLVFLAQLDKFYPDVSKVCASVGISRDTYENHYALDLKFQLLVNAIREKHVDQIERVRFKLAKTSKGGLDRMAVLNAYRSERYLQKTKIEIEHTMNPEEARARAARLASVLDAEVVSTVKRVRARNRGEAAP